MGINKLANRVIVEDEGNETVIRVDEKSKTINSSEKSL
jgi:hypothetical protein